MNHPHTCNEQSLSALRLHGVVAVFLMFCFGMMLPTVAAPMRACILDQEVHTAGFATFGETETGMEKCCPDCGSPQEGGSCCVEIKRLPDAPEAIAPSLLPPIVFFEIPDEIVVTAPVVLLASHMPPSTPIRGPDAPGVLRARLSVWNI